MLFEKCTYAGVPTLAGTGPILKLQYSTKTQMLKFKNIDHDFD